MLCVPGGEERKTHLVLATVYGPEVTRPRLAVAGAAGFNRRLVHVFDAAAADRVKLRGINRLEKPNPLLDQLGEPGAAHPNAAVLVVGQCCPCTKLQGGISWTMLCMIQ